MSKPVAWLRGLPSKSGSAASTGTPRPIAGDLALSRKSGVPMRLYSTKAGSAAIVPTC